ncbi:MAG: hypothetical protein ACXVAW_14045 [Vulcanimicrobiaceae bacterium]
MKGTVRSTLMRNTNQRNRSLLPLVVLVAIAAFVAILEWISAHAPRGTGAAAPPMPAQPAAPAPSAPPSPQPGVQSTGVPSASPSPAGTAVPSPPGSALPAVPSPSAMPFASPSMPPPSGTLASPGPIAVPSKSPAPAVVMLPPNAAPRILNVALSSNVVKSGEVVSGTVTTSSNVASVEARIAGYSSSLQKVDDGHFTLSYRVPDLPSFLHKTYTLVMIARNTRGDATSTTMPITVR